MKWLQPRKWISIFPEKEGKRKEMEISSTQTEEEEKALVHQNIFGQQLPEEKIYLSSVCLSVIAH